MQALYGFCHSFRQWSTYSFDLDVRANVSLYVYYYKLSSINWRLIHLTHLVRRKSYWNCFKLLGATTDTYNETVPHKVNKASSCRGTGNRSKTKWSSHPEGAIQRCWNDQFNNSIGIKAFGQKFVYSCSSKSASVPFFIRSKSEW